MVTYRRAEINRVSGQGLECLQAQTLTEVLDGQHAVQEAPGRVEKTPWRRWSSTRPRGVGKRGRK